jgi:hypothetical protein
LCGVPPAQSGGASIFFLFSSREKIFAQRQKKNSSTVATDKLLAR